MKPVLKWVGGKQSLLDQMAPYMPKPNQCAGYVAPFAGGEALFFCQYNAVRPTWLADTNPELVALYKAIRDDVDELIALTREHESLYNGVVIDEKKRLYKFVANEHVSHSSSYAYRGARLLFLNRTCFNGLYRTNRAGKFNVAWGKKANVRILFEDELRAAHSALQGVEIRHASFQDTFRDAPIGKETLLYLDPPYVPRSKSECFDSYGPNKFSWKEQGDLLTLAEKAAERGAIVVASNAWVPEIVSLYRRSKAGFNVVEISANRNVACNAESREPVSEMLATNWRNT